MYSSELPTQLRERLARPLPGRKAQERFAPELCYGRHFGPPTHTARQASVMVMIYPESDRWYLPLTLRPPTLKAHGGQICLPGGAVEAGESPEQTALRELHEELGVGASLVEIVGRLSTIYLFVSDFVVTPCVAAAWQRPDFVADPAEVAELIPLPLDVLVDPECRGESVRTLGEPPSAPLPSRGMLPTYRAPHIAWQGQRVWGATAIILSELIAVLAEIPAETSGPAK